MSAAGSSILRDCFYLFAFFLLEVSLIDRVLPARQSQIYHFYFSDRKLHLFLIAENDISPRKF